LFQMQSWTWNNFDLEQKWKCPTKTIFWIILIQDVVVIMIVTKDIVFKMPKAMIFMSTNQQWCVPSVIVVIIFLCCWCSESLFNASSGGLKHTQKDIFVYVGLRRFCPGYKNVSNLDILL
jgi:hypothetical protein